MIIVHAKALVKEGAQRKFAEAAANCVTETNKEQGCIGYRLVNDCADNRVFMFVELWETQAALDAHMQTPHFKALGPAIAELLDGPFGADVFEAVRK
jgi:quinol monooxygenase YgiN